MKDLDLIATLERDAERAKSAWMPIRYDRDEILRLCELARVGVAARAKAAMEAGDFS